jgi:Spy/CpxP family protein refolding chaperone
MKKYAAAATIAGVLLLSWGVLAQQAPAQEKQVVKPEPGPRAPFERLKEFLNLTPEQEAKLKDFQKARQEEQKAFREQMQKLRGELSPLLRDPKADEKKINGLIDQITKLNADRMKKAIANRNPLQKILTQEQLDKLKNMPGRFIGLGRGFDFGPGLGLGARPMGPGRFMRPGLGFMAPQRFRGQGMMNFPRGRVLMRRMFLRNRFWR